MILEEASALLARTPWLLDGWLRGMPEAWLDARTEGEKTFTARDVLGHLISAERDDWIPRARIILEHGEARAFDPFERFDFPRGSVNDLLDEFTRLRGASLGTLQAMRLTSADLAKRGRHPDPSFGPVTLGQLLSTWVVHDLSHVAQIARVMGKRYGDDVGPWKAYLPMLTR